MTYNTELDEGDLSVHYAGQIDDDRDITITETMEKLGYTLIIAVYNFAVGFRELYFEPATSIDLTT